MAKLKAVDTWKTKQWYNVFAPEMFEAKKLAALVATEDKLLLNRKVRISLSELTGDMSQAYTLLDFRIVDVKGRSANTIFIGHELSKSYLRTLIRRRRHVIGDVIDVTSKDGKGMRVKVSIFSGTKVSTPTRAAIRHAVREETLKTSAESEFSRLVQEIIFGKFASRLYHKIRKLAPIRSVEIRKTELKETFA